MYVIIVFKDDKLNVIHKIYVTGFVKTCIVHTSTFSTLKIHNICYDYSGMKLVIVESVEQISDLNVLNL